MPTKYAQVSPNLQGDGDFEAGNSTTETEQQKEVPEEDILEQQYLRKKQKKRRKFCQTIVCILLLIGVSFFIGIENGEASSADVPDQPSEPVAIGGETESFTLLLSEDGSKKAVIEQTIDSLTLRFKNLPMEDGYFDVGKGWCLNFAQDRIFEEVRWDHQSDSDDRTSLCKSACELDALCIGYMTHDSKCSQITTKDPGAASGIYLADGDRDYHCFAKQRDLHKKFIFRFGEVGGTECPRGFKFITDQKECHEAADYLQTRKEFDESQYEDKVGANKLVGCFLSSRSRKIHFNSKNLDGAVDDHYDQHVCVLKDDLFEERKSKKGQSGRAGPTNENVLCADNRKFNGGVEGSESMCASSTGDGRIMMADCDVTCIQTRCEDDDACAGWEQYMDFYRPVNSIEWVYGTSGWITVEKKTNTFIAKCHEAQGDANFRFLSQGDRLPYHSCAEAKEESEDDICEMTYLEFYQSMFNIDESTWINIIAPDIEPDSRIDQDCKCTCGTGEFDYADRPTKPPVPTFAPVRRGEASEDDGAPIEPAEVEPAPGSSDGDKVVWDDPIASLNCWSKFGAIELAVNGEHNSLDECKVLCEEDSECTCITRNNDGGCWTRKNCKVAMCRTGMDDFHSLINSRNPDRGPKESGIDWPVMPAPTFGPFDDEHAFEGGKYKQDINWFKGGEEIHNKWPGYTMDFGDKFKDMSLNDRLDILKEQVERMQNILVGYYTADSLRLNGSQIMEHTFLMTPEASHFDYEAHLDVIADRFARAFVYDRKFKVGGIGSSVMAGHDNCAYDTYQNQLNRILQPVFHSAGFLFEIVNAGMTGGCGDNHENQTPCFTHTLGDDIDSVHYSWTYFEHGDGKYGVHERLIRWAAMLPKVPFLNVIYTGGCSRNKGHMKDYGDGLLVKKYGPTLAYNILCMMGGAQDGAGYVKRKGSVGDNMHFTTRYGEKEKSSRKNSLGVMFRNWHPGPLLFQHTADGLAWLYMKAMIRAINLIKAVDNPKEKWSEYPPRPDILDSDAAYDCYPYGKCTPKRLPVCYNGEIPTYGDPGIEWIRPDHPEYPDWVNKSAYQWERFYAPTTKLIPRKEKNWAMCAHRDRCAGWRDRRAPKFEVSSDYGWIVFKFPKLEIGRILICLLGDVGGSIYGWRFNVNGKEMQRPENGWGRHFKKCYVVQEKFENEEDANRDFHFVAILLGPNPDHWVGAARLSHVFGF